MMSTETLSELESVSEEVVDSEIGVRQSAGRPMLRSDMFAGTCCPDRDATTFSDLENAALSANSHIKMQVAIKGTTTIAGASHLWHARSMRWTRSGSSPESKTASMIVLCKRAIISVSLNAGNVARSSSESAS